MERFAVERQALVLDETADPSVARPERTGYFLFQLLWTSIGWKLRIFSQWLVVFYIRSVALAGSLSYLMHYISLFLVVYCSVFCRETLSRRFMSSNAPLLAAPLSVLAATSTATTAHLKESRWPCLWRILAVQAWAQTSHVMPRWHKKKTKFGRRSWSVFKAFHQDLIVLCTWDPNTIPSWEVQPKRSEIPSQIFPICKNVIGPNPLIFTWRWASRVSRLKKQKELQSKRICPIPSFSTDGDEATIDQWFRYPCRKALQVQKSSKQLLRSRISILWLSSCCAISAFFHVQ